MNLVTDNIITHHRKVIHFNQTSIFNHNDRNILLIDETFINLENFCYDIVNKYLRYDFPICK